MSDLSTPIEIDVKSAKPGTSDFVSLRTFDSYQFERSVLTPATAFRFTAPGVDSSLRQSIRSGDMATIWVQPPSGSKQQVGTGFIDETDTHVTPTSIEYVLTGRDTTAQLVDNATVDENNRIINVTQLAIDKILGTLIKNTRIPQGYKTQQCPNGALLFQTNAGETKINALQRYLEYTNCLVWSQPNGQLVVGKPNFAQAKSGVLALSPTKTSGNNVLEARVRRNLNQSIRKVVTQLQTMDQVDAGQFTKLNQDQDMKAVSASGVGRSVYNVFSYGQGSDAVNQITQVGNHSGAPRSIGEAISLREIARENMKVIEVEAVVRGHVNDNGFVYNVDQVYEVQIEADNVFEDMYVYSVSYELTLAHGMLTRLRLCRKGTICADSAIISGGTA